MAKETKPCKPRIHTTGEIIIDIAQNQPKTEDRLQKIPKRESILSLSTQTIPQREGGKRKQLELPTTTTISSPQPIQTKIPKILVQDEYNHIPIIPKQPLNPKEKKRGAFIVFEGIDKAGKTTQAKSLVEWLCKKEMPAIYFAFPERSTPIGQIINTYLQTTSTTTPKDDLTQECDAKTMHLLFSANRWECIPKIMHYIKSGVHVICDRYAYSGVAYTIAKNCKHATPEWCKSADQNLPIPDLVFYLDVNPTLGAQRANYGREACENIPFQSLVHNAYQQQWDFHHHWGMEIDTTTVNISQTKKQVRSKTLFLIKQANDLDLPIQFKLFK
jgi:dTMP kinase